MSKKRLTLLSLFLLLSAFAFAQQDIKIEQKITYQSDSDIVIEYTIDLGGYEWCDVSLYLSYDGGKTFMSDPLSGVSGDIGRITASGDKKAIWSIGDNLDIFVDHEVAFKIDIVSKGKSKKGTGAATTTVASTKAPKPAKTPKPASTSRFPGKTMIQVGLGFDTGSSEAQKLTYGLTIGWVKRWGVYGKFKTNAVFKESDIDSYSTDVWVSEYSGASISNWSFAVGTMCAFIPQLYLNIGLGYGTRALYWEDIHNDIVKITDYSNKGVLADIGLTARFGVFSLSVGTTCMFGASEMRKVYLEPEVRIGFMF